MSSTTSALLADIDRLSDNCAAKRDALLALAARVGRVRRRLNLLAALLALLSSCSLVSLLAGMGGELAIKLVAAVFSLAAGIVSVCLAAQTREEDVAMMLEGAALYLRLREDALQLRSTYDTEREALAVYSRQLLEYANLDARFNRFWGEAFARSDRYHEARAISDYARFPKRSAARPVHVDGKKEPAGDVGGLSD